MLSNLLRLVIIVCIHGIKNTKRWFRESPTEQGDTNPGFPSATSVYQSEASIARLLCRGKEEEALLSSRAPGLSAATSNGFTFPLILFFKIRNLVEGF